MELYNHIHLSDEETEAQRGRKRALCLTAAWEAYNCVIAKPDVAPSWLSLRPRRGLSPRGIGHRGQEVQEITSGGQQPGWPEDRAALTQAPQGLAAWEALEGLSFTVETSSPSHMLWKAQNRAWLRLLGPHLGLSQCWPGQ